MGIFKLEKDAYLTIEKDGKKLKLIKKDKWKDFNSYVLGIGDISTDSTIKSVICAFFDLEGFTKFCNQIDPDLVIPKFLKKYLDWFFTQIQEETTENQYEEGIDTWHDLPFFIKFMGDGLLILWDISNISKISEGNIIVSSLGITQRYSEYFFPMIKKSIVDPPKKLRCGIAKGKVFSVGDGTDFVGPCINFASRIQKLPGITFAFSNRGIDEAFFENREGKYIIKIIETRGIGENELVCILTDEYNKMNRFDKKFYRDV